MNKKLFVIATNLLNTFLQSAIENCDFTFYEKLPVLGVCSTPDGEKMYLYTLNWVNMFS